MKTKISWFDRIMVAVTFAEANEHGEAKSILYGAEQNSEKQQYCKECDVIFATDLHRAEARS